MYVRTDVVCIYVILCIYTYTCTYKYTYIPTLTNSDIYIYNDRIIFFVFRSNSNHRAPAQDVSNPPPDALMVSAEPYGPPLVLWSLWLNPMAVRVGPNHPSPSPSRPRLRDLKQPWWPLGIPKTNQSTPKKAMFLNHNSRGDLPTWVNCLCLYSFITWMKPPGVRPLRDLSMAWWIPDRVGEIFGNSHSMCTFIWINMNQYESIWINMNQYESIINMNQ